MFTFPHLLNLGSVIHHCNLFLTYTLTMKDFFSFSNQCDQKKKKNQLVKLNSLSTMNLPLVAERMIMTRENVGYCKWVPSSRAWQSNITFPLLMHNSTLWYHEKAPLLLFNYPTFLLIFSISVYDIASKKIDRTPGPGTSFLLRTIFHVLLIFVSI